MSLASYHCSTPGYNPVRVPELARVRVAGRLASAGLGRASLGRTGRRSRGRSGLGTGAAVAFEDPRWRKFAELVAHHILGHEQLQKLSAVVNQEGVADEIRHDRAIARPGLDWFTMPGLLFFDLCQQPQIYVRPFLQRASHSQNTPYSPNILCTKPVPARGCGCAPATAPRSADPVAPA